MRALTTCSGVATLLILMSCGLDKVPLGRGDPAEGSAGAASDLGADGSAGTSTSDDGGRPSEDEVAPCDPLASDEQPVTLGTVVAVGEAQDGTIFVVDEIETEEPRVFVLDGKQLVRVRVVGSGWTSSSGVDTHELEFEAPAGGYWTLAIEIRDGETRMGLVRQNDFERPFEEVVDAGEELTVLDESTISGLEVRNLPGEVEIEYIARVESGDHIVVVRPRDDWTYEDFRLFYGADSVLTERRVAEVRRAQDGGTTCIEFELDGAEAIAYFPVSMSGPVESATLTVGDESATLTVLDSEMGLTDFSFLCFAGADSGVTDPAPGTGGAGGDSSCVGDDCAASELPSGFTSAVQIPIVQTDCLEDSEASEEHLFWRDDERTVAAWEHAVFRCDQAVCGFMVQEDETSRVLLRPCDMNPTMVPQCVSAYNIEFEVTWPTDIVEVYRQGDNYGTGENGAIVYDVGKLDRAGVDEGS